jgi:hypothetical protein
MNTDLSFNHITHRRAGAGGSGGGDPERYGATYRERFELNQYYNAVEDEQIYMDEYTTLSHRYNEFMMNANAMYMRMEQTLRESLTRTMVRQSFYYHRVQENVAGGGGVGVGMGMGMGMGARHDAVPAAVPAPPQALPPAPAVAGAATRLGEVFPRLLSRYFSTELNRDAREANTGNRRVDAMLYTFPIPRAGGGGGGGAAGSGSGVPRPGPGAPTNDQIGRATLNTVFSNIISPVNATCPISRDEFDDNSDITMIRGCNHIFNRVSLREWFVHHSTCPMCRCDIRLYDPSASAAASAAGLVERPREREPVVQPDATNISIDRVDDDSITFSYDLPVEYGNEQIYNDIMNRVMGGRMPQTAPSRHDHDHGGDDDDDIMEVD